MAGRKAEGGKWAVQVERTSQVTSIFMGVPEQKVAGAQFSPQWLVARGSVWVPTFAIKTLFWKSCRAPVTLGAQIASLNKIVPRTDDNMVIARFSYSSHQNRTRSMPSSPCWGCSLDSASSCKEEEGADIYVIVVFRGHHLCVAPWELEIRQSEWRCTVSVTHTQDFEDLVPLPQKSILVLWRTVWRFL